MCEGFYYGMYFSLSEYERIKKLVNMTFDDIKFSYVRNIMKLMDALLVSSIVV